MARKGRRKNRRVRARMGATQQEQQQQTVQGSAAEMAVLPPETRVSLMNITLWLFGAAMVLVVFYAVAVAFLVENPTFPLLSAGVTLLTLAFLSRSLLKTKRYVLQNMK